MKKREEEYKTKKLASGQFSNAKGTREEEYYLKMDQVIEGAWKLIGNDKLTTEGTIVMHLLDGTRMPEATRAMIGSMIDAAVFEQEEINVECDETNN